MSAILSAASELQRKLLENDWPFCFIGGVAVLRWGQPRTTQDVDVSLFAAPGGEKEIIRRLLEYFPSRVNDAAEFAMTSRVILAQSDGGVPYDIVLAKFDFEKAIIDRASYFEYSDQTTLLTISAEDLVVMKSFAGREQDWLDVRGIIDCNNELNLNSIRIQLRQLSELQPENQSLQQFDDLCDRT